MAKPTRRTATQIREEQLAKQFTSDAIRRHLDSLTSMPSAVIPASSLPPHWTVPPILPTWQDGYDQIPDDYESTFDPYNSNKESPMKLFTFATEKPSASIIWNTLLDSDIPASDGLTVLQIKYLIFYAFQNVQDFVLVKTNINNKLDAIPVPGLWSGLGLDLSVVRGLITDIPGYFPHWVSDDLYIPYYITKQLPNPGMNIFDTRVITTAERRHIDIDESPTTTSSLTAYSYWRYAYDPMLVCYIDPTLSYVDISSRMDMERQLKSQLHSAFIEAEDHIITSGPHYAINPFRLISASDVPSPSAEPAHKFEVGDLVRLRSNITAGMTYGNSKLYDHMITAQEMRIEAYSPSGNYEAGLFIYSYEMLELVEKGTAV